MLVEGGRGIHDAWINTLAGDSFVRALYVLAKPHARDTLRRYLWRTNPRLLKRLKDTFDNVDCCGVVATRMDGGIKMERTN